MQALLEDRLRQTNADQQSSDQLHTDSLAGQLTEVGTALPLSSDLRSHAVGWDSDGASSAAGTNLSPSQCSR